MLVSIFRTVVLFTLVIVVLRIMGKRQIAELQPFELAITIMVSALAAVPMEDTDIPLTNTVIPILILLAMQVFISSFVMKTERGRVLICGKPAILIANGQISETSLDKHRMHINDLLSQLRSQGYANLSDVEFAILESDGNFSVIPKSQARPVTPADLDISTEYEGLPYLLISDGEIQDHNLNKLGLSRDWLREELKKFDIDDPHRVFFASIDTSGNLFYQKKQDSQQN